MSHQTPKPFDFGDLPQPPADPIDRPAVPRAFDFGDEAGAPPVNPTSPPKPLSFADLPPAPSTGLPANASARALFDSDDHPAVRDALACASVDYPELLAHSQQRLAALFRRILPVRLALVTEWAEAPLMEQAALLAPMTALVLKFADMAVPALLEDALDSTRAPSGVLGKLFRRPTPPALYKPALTSARAQLIELMADSEVAMRNLEASAHNLNLHGAALSVVSTLTGDAADATLADALVQRRTLIAQAVRQAELSILQMGQVRQQAADLIGQISSFLTVTLPALEMAQAQGGG